MVKRHNILRLNEEGRLLAYDEALKRNDGIPGELLYEMIVQEETPAIVKAISKRKTGRRIYRNRFLFMAVY